jgi:hypothetical protein
MYTPNSRHHRGQAFHEALDGELSDVIRIAERQIHDAIQTRHGDDPAGPGRAHGRQHSFGDARDPEEVELHRLRQLIHRELFQRSPISGAGVVDQQVDTPRSVRMERMPESTDSSLVTSRALSSTPDNSSAIPQRFRRLRMASGCYDLPAGCGQRAGGCQPYASARAGDHCYRRHISPIS